MKESLFAFLFVLVVRHTIAIQTKIALFTVNASLPQEHVLLVVLRTCLARSKNWKCVKPIRIANIHPRHANKVIVKFSSFAVPFVGAKSPVQKTPIVMILVRNVTKVAAILKNNAKAERT